MGRWTGSSGASGWGTSRSATGSHSTPAVRTSRSSRSDQTSWATTTLGSCRTTGPTWRASCCMSATDPSSCRSDLLQPGHESGVSKSGPKTPFAWTDLTYLLHRAGVSWGYYVGNGTDLTCLEDRIACTLRGTPGEGTPAIWNPLPNFTTVREGGQLDNIRKVSGFLKAARDGTLPAVSWVVPDGEHSEHPPSSIVDGQTYVTQLINADMTGPNWDTSAIFLAWDDWGGFYDHVVPPRVDV